MFSSVVGQSDKGAGDSGSKYRLRHQTFKIIPIILNTLPSVVGSEMERQRIPDQSSNSAIFFPKLFL
jgi:hypothetical protein